MIIILYLMACLPVAAGAVLWGLKKEVCWWEWLVGSLAGFFVAGIMHIVAVSGMTSDYETWSGQLAVATFYPEWVEKYKVAVYKTVTKRVGKTTTTERVFSHYETRYRTHHERWELRDTLGQEKDVGKAECDAVAASFGGYATQNGNKSGFYKGDPNVYVATNKTGVLHPTTTWRSFENRIKAAPSLFSFAKVPEGTPVHAYPSNRNWRESNRLLGTAAGTIGALDWDQMNSRLGPVKFVNVIAIGFGPDADSSIAQHQQASWVGGRKNDVVICYGGGTPTRPRWAYVFGWTESELAKRNLESIVLDNEVTGAIIPKIEAEIRQNYEIKDWTKFDYITIEPPTWAYVVALILMLGSQGGYWFWAMTNDEDKDSHGFGYRRGRF
jgi:hypothetical protein